MSIQPIPTEHNGYPFRSRLEARWAYFFDLVHAPYLYEMEGFKLKSGELWYCPDFWLVEGQMWVEIKPYAPTSEEMDKAFYLAMETGQSAVILCGDPYGLLEAHWYLAPPKSEAERREESELRGEPVSATDVVYMRTKEVAYLWIVNPSKESRGDGSSPFDLILYPYLKMFDDLGVKTNPHALMPVMGPCIYLTTDIHKLEARMHQFWKPKGH